MFVLIVVFSFSPPLIVSATIFGFVGGGEFFIGCPLPPPDFRSVVCIFAEFFARLVPLLAACALLVFFWGLVKFVNNTASETVRDDAKNIMFWGIIALFVMMSIWGIVFFFFQDLFGGGVGVHPFGIPKLPFSPD